MDGTTDIDTPIQRQRGTGLHERVGVRDGSRDGSRLHCRECAKGETKRQEAMEGTNAGMSVDEKYELR